MRFTVLLTGLLLFGKALAAEAIFLDSARPKIEGLRILRIRVDPRLSGDAERMARVEGRIRPGRGFLYWEDEPLTHSRDQSRFELALPLTGPFTPVSLLLKDRGRVVRQAKFYVHVGPEEPTPPSAGVESPLPPARREPARLALRYSPRYLTLSQTLQSTLEELSVGHWLGTALELQYAFRFQDRLGILIEAGFMQWKQDSLLLGNYSLQPSTANLLRSGATLQFFQRQREPLETRVTLGLAYSPNFLLEFSDNTSLALTRIAEWNGTIGFGISVQSLDLWLGYGRGLDAYRTSLTTFESSDHYLAQVEFRRLFSDDWSTSVRMNGSWQRSTYLIERDTWVQQKRELGVGLGIQKDW